MEGGTIAFNQHCIQWLQNLVINSSVCMVKVVMCDVCASCKSTF